MSDLLQAVYSAFSPKPLRPDQKELYVDLDEARGNVGVVTRMERKIRLADAPTCQVLAGHRGSGKSTELGRLQSALETPDSKGERFFVVFCEADEDIDRNDVDFPEVLIAIVRQVAYELEKRLGILLEPGYFKDRLGRLKKLLKSEISFDSSKLNLGLTELSFLLKSSPDARQSIRKHLEPDTSNWLKAANDVLGKATLELKKKGYSGLAVMVDDLDKMVQRHHEAGCSTTEYLFVHRSAQLTSFGCHMVYTMPLELAYSHLEQTIKGLYGGHVPVVPMTRIFSRPPTSKPWPKGIEKFRQIIHARLSGAGASESRLFTSNKVRDELVRLSGGQPTELMTLVREALVTQGMPIDSAALERCRTEGRRSYERQLRADHWPILQSVRETGRVTRTQDNEAAFRELLESRAILLFMNDEEWYAVNPYLAGLAPPRISSAAGSESPS